MAYQQQQQSSIGMIVDQCCEDEASYNDLSSQIIAFVQSTQNKDVKFVIDAIKKAIKSKKTDSPSKVLALKLLHRCITEGNNEELFMYTEKKIMKRLTIYAKHRKESTDLDKGSLLFGKTFNQKASADFLKLLLVFIQKWGTKYQAYPSTHRQTEMNKIYQQLLKEHVHFPSEDSVMYSLTSNYNQDHHNAQRSPNSTKLSSPNGSQAFNRDQFRSHQLAQPQSQSDLRQSSQHQFSTHVQPGAHQQQQPAQMTKEQMQEQAERIRKDYKKMIEYSKTAQNSDEILTMMREGGQMDDELLVQMRNEIKEGLIFSESYLKLLMETTFTIKDKEQKIEKILGIINDISTHLSKFEAVRPFSPRSLAILKQKQDEEEHKQYVPQQTSSESSRSQPVAESPQDQITSERTQGQRPKSRQARPVRNDPMRRSVQPPEENDLHNDISYNNDVFKTNFMASQNNQESVKFSLSEAFWMKNLPGKQENLQEKEEVKVEKRQEPKSLTKRDIMSPHVQEEKISRNSILSSKDSQKEERKSIGKVDLRKSKVQEENLKEQNNKEGRVSLVKNVVSPKKQPSEEKKSDDKSNSIFKKKREPKPPSNPSSQSKPFGVFKNFSKNPTILQEHSPDSNISSDEETHQINPNRSVNPFNFDFGVPQQELFQNTTEPEGFDFGVPVQNQNIPEPDAFSWDFTQPSQAPSSNQQRDNNGFTFERQSIPTSPKKLRDDTELLNLRQREYELTDKVHELEELVKELKLQNDELIGQLLKANDQNKSHLTAQQELAKDKQALQDENSELLMELRKLRNFEFLYEEEKLQRVQLENDLTITKTKLEEHQKTIDRYENKMIQKEKLIQSLNEELKEKDYLHSSLDNKQLEIDKLQRELINKSKNIEDLQGKLDQAETKFASLQSQDLEKNEGKHFKLVKNTHTNFSSPVIRLKKSQIQVNATPPQLQVMNASPAVSLFSQAIQFNKEETMEQANKEEPVGFSLDQFLIADQPKKFEEVTVEIVDPTKPKKEDISFEEMFAQAPSSDSDQESTGRQHEKWQFAKAFYQESDNPTPGEFSGKAVQRDSQKVEFPQKVEEMKVASPVTRGEDMKREGTVVLDQEEKPLESNMWNFGQTTVHEDTKQEENHEFWNFQTEDNQIPEEDSSASDQYHDTKDEIKDLDIEDPKQQIQPVALTEPVNQQELIPQQPKEEHIQEFKPVLQEQQYNVDDFFTFEQVQTPRQKMMQQKIEEEKQRQQEAEKHMLEESKREVQLETVNLGQNVSDFNFQDLVPAKVTEDESNKVQEHQEVDRQHTSLEEKYSITVNQEQIEVITDQTNNIDPHKGSPPQTSNVLENTQSITPQKLEDNKKPESPKMFDLTPYQPNAVISQTSPPQQVVLMQPIIEVTPSNTSYMPLLTQSKSYELTPPTVNQIGSKSQEKAFDPFEELFGVNPSTNKSSDKQFSHYPKDQTSTSQMQRSLSSNKADDLMNKFNSLNLPQRTSDIQRSISSDIMPQRPSMPVVNQQPPLQQHPHPAHTQRLAMQDDIHLRTQSQGSLQMHPNEQQKGIQISSELQRVNSQIQSSHAQIGQQQQIIPQRKDSFQSQFSTHQPLLQTSLNQEHKPVSSQQFGTNNYRDNNQLGSMLQQEVHPPVHRASMTQLPSQLSAQQQQALTASQALPQHNHHDPHPSHPPTHMLSNQQPHQTSNQPHQNQNLIMNQQQQPHPLQQKQMAPPSIQQPQQDVSLNKNQFSTANTQQYYNQQQQQQQQLDPQAILRMVLAGFFKKSLVSNKSVLYEDSQVQIGCMANYSGDATIIKLFFASKNQQSPLENITLKEQLQPTGYRASQTRDSIAGLKHGDQELIEITLKIASFKFNIPVYSLNYRTGGKASGNIPIRLPVILLKFCSHVKNIDSNGYLQGWNTECSFASEAKKSFNIDFNMCRSISSLKEALMFGVNAFTFVDGVEPEKNVVCGVTMFNLQPYYAFVKIRISPDGQNCEIIGRSNDKEHPGEFAKLVMSNILELIALKINQ